MEQSRPKLEPMRRAHLAGCARLYAEVFNQPPWQGKWTSRTAAKHIEESLQDANFRGIIVLEQRQPVAFAYGLVTQWENERRFYLKEMCVLGRSQRSGMGTRLLRQLTTNLQKENVCQISLGTERATPAESFYLRLGFAIDSQVMIMKKRLRPSARSTGKRT